MTTPMDDIHSLRKRVADEVEDLADLLNFAVVPRDNGPDIIHISFSIKSDAVKSSDEIESEDLADDFFDVLGDMDFEVSNDGLATITGGTDAADEITTEERDRREALKQKRIQEMLDSLKDDDDDKYEV